MEMDGSSRTRKQSKISQLVAPIVSITRKISRREKQEDFEEAKVIDEDVDDEKVDDLGDVSDEFISQMREVFKEFDKDKSGFICTRELGPLLRAMGNNPTHAEVNNLMARADVDHNGKLDLAEFILMMHNNQLEMMDQDDEQVRKMMEMKQAFRAFDTRGDGKIAIQDMKLFLRCFGDMFDEPDMEDLIARFDENKNGFFEMEEFIKFLNFVQY